MTGWPATPGPYGWNASPAHVARVEAEIARQREQRARRNAARTTTPKETR